MVLTLPWVDLYGLFTHDDAAVSLYGAGNSFLVTRSLHWELNNLPYECVHNVVIMIFSCFIFVWYMAELLCFFLLPSVAVQA
jgi:hypothetical protein